MKTLKEIAFWIIAILFLGMFTCFFSSCEMPEVVTATSPIYEYPYDGCMYIGNASGEMEHSATCTNTKHTCICYNEVYE